MDTRSCVSRKLDGNKELIHFAQTLEDVCVKTIESGKMTKDLAVCIYGEKVTADKYLNTEPFLEELNKALAARLKM